MVVTVEEEEESTATIAAAVAGDGEGKATSYMNKNCHLTYSDYFSYEYIFSFTLSGFHCAFPGVLWGIWWCLRHFLPLLNVASAVDAQVLH